MTIICTAEPDTIATTAIAGVPTVVADPAAADRLLAERPAEALVVVGPDIRLTDAAAFAARLRLGHPAVGVVLVRHEAGVDTYATAIRAGIREVVAAGDEAALADACRRSLAVSRAGQRRPDRPRRTGKVVTVFATKGGCGKTTIATNLAVTLHAGGARRVCVVDLDLAFGDVAITLQLAPKRTLIDAAAMGEDLDETGLAGLLTSFRPGLDCVLAPVEPGDAEKVPTAAIEDLLTVLRGMFDYVVVDTPPQFNEHVLKALDLADHHVLLATPDLPTLKNLRLTIDMLDLLGYPRQARSIVVNREDPRVGMTVADIERALKTDVVGRVPASTAVPASVNGGVPITIAKPDHRVSAAIREFGERCITGVPAKSARRRFLSYGKHRRSHATQ